MSKYQVAVLMSAIFLGLFYLVQPQLMPLLGLAVGLGLGSLIMVGDELFAYRWYTEQSQHFLITRSPLFWLSYVPLALFIITSSGSLIGQGMMVGIGWWLVWEMWQLCRDRAAFASRFLTQVTRPFSMAELQALPVIAGVLFLIVAFSVLR